MVPDLKPVLLLGPDGERPFSDAAIERELRAMWKSAAPERGALYRAALANVIAPLDPDPRDPLDPVLVELTRRHPSRLFRIEHTPGGGASAAGGARPEGGAPIRARATALCHVRPGGGGLVCSEQIVLTADRGAASLVPSAVASLLVGDLPVILLRLDRERDPARDAALEAISDIILEDSATRDDAEAMARLWRRAAGDGAGRVRDIAWARLMPWREILAEVFDQPAAAAAAGEIQDVAIHHGGAAPPAGAWLLAGWLASRLGWAPRGRSGRRFRFDGRRRPVSVSFERDEDVHEPVTTAVRVRSGTPAPLDVRIAHRGRDATATLEFLAPAPRTLERAFRYRELAACLIGEIHRHEPNRTMERSAEIAASLVAMPSGS
ncbi:MAG TPA: glucose-6-phosphate dehydrogenase assembly protein OpcA [Acidobacteriota bacterium]|nr:glucose-6-phosphate dehydrogenase assembly protein OpcA [Acidobacteriota bacterium]